MPKKVEKIKMSERQEELLKIMSTGRNVKSSYKQRADILLRAKEGETHTSIAKVYDIQINTVIKWRNKWIRNYEEIMKTETEEPKKLKEKIENILSDCYRSGSKGKFKEEQKTKIIAISLELPEKMGVPISQWSPKQLAKKVMELGIVESISERQVGRYLKKMDIKIHKYKGWLNPKERIKNPEKYDKQMNEICETYKNAIELEKQNIHVICTDEKTGITAFEHLHPALPVKPGRIERCEYEYKRHGATSLIASRNVATGEIIKPLIKPTRTEKDFLEHFKNVVATNPNDRFIFIMDQLNTHKSESLVKFIADNENIDISSLGVKFKSGILKNIESRTAFLSDKNHKIRIVFTPKHSSWLNQIEIWFSILTRQLLNKRFSFTSLEHLKSKIIEFINYYNLYSASPFKWTFAGKILQI